MSADIEKARSWYQKAEKLAHRQQEGGSTLLQPLVRCLARSPRPSASGQGADQQRCRESDFSSILALLRLTTRSNLTARSIGRSAGWVPFITSRSSNASPSNSNIIRMNELVPSSLVDLVASDSFPAKDKDQLTRRGRRRRPWAHSASSMATSEPAPSTPSGKHQGGQRRWLTQAWRLCLGWSH